MFTLFMDRIRKRRGRVRESPQIDFTPRALRKLWIFKFYHADNYCKSFKVVWRLHFVRFTEGFFVKRLCRSNDIRVWHGLGRWCDFSLSDGGSDHRAPVRPVFDRHLSARVRVEFIIGPEGFSLFRFRIVNGAPRILLNFLNIFETFSIFFQNFRVLGVIEVYGALK